MDSWNDLLVEMVAYQILIQWMNEWWINMLVIVMPNC